MHIALKTHVYTLNINIASYFLQLNSLSYVIFVTGHHVTKFELNFAKYSCSIIVYLSHAFIVK